MDEYESDGDGAPEVAAIEDAVDMSAVNGEGEETVDMNAENDGDGVGALRLLDARMDEDDDEYEPDYVERYRFEEHLISSDEPPTPPGELQNFDVSLAAAHSYMGPGLIPIRGRSVLEPGWEGTVPVMASRGTVFPGETIPILFTYANDVQMITEAIKKDKLFGFVCQDENGSSVTGYGVLCEVYEMGLQQRDAGALGAARADRSLLACKARALHRFRFSDMPDYALPVQDFERLKPVCVRVLPDLQLHEPLRHARLASLDPLRRARTPLDRRLRAMDAATTPWPLFVYDIFDYQRMRDVLRHHLEPLNLAEKMPEGAVALSFWAASNLTLSARERLALFVVDDAPLRLHMLARFMARTSVLCCAACGGEVARREHAVVMSSEGVHSNYTNNGGFLHDIVTMSHAVNLRLAGMPSAEYTWFPGYTWTIANCASCNAHLGWRFNAMSRNLRPRQFFGICRNYISPRVEEGRRHRAMTPPPPPQPQPPQPQRRSRTPRAHPALLAHSALQASDPDFDDDV